MTYITKAEHAGSYEWFSGSLEEWLDGAPTVTVEV